MAWRVDLSAWSASRSDARAESRSTTARRRSHLAILARQIGTRLAIARSASLISGDGFGGWLRLSRRSHQWEGANIATSYRGGRLGTTPERARRRRAPHSARGRGLKKLRA
eukprot:scaffold269909_cov37-Tisochrysis_lutea.AAC.1